MTSGDDQGEAQFLGAVPVFLVDDVEATAEYYRERLDFEIDFLYGEPPFFGSVSRGDAILNFTKSTPPGRRNNVQSAGPGNGVDAYIVLGHGLDDLHTEYRARGVDIRAAPESQAYGMREFYVEDCNGYILAFAQEADEDE